MLLYPGQVVVREDGPWHHGRQDQCRGPGGGHVVRMLEAALSEAAAAFVLAVGDTVVRLRRLMRRHVVLGGVRGLLSRGVTGVALTGPERPRREPEEEHPHGEGAERTDRAPVGGVSGHVLLSFFVPTSEHGTTHG